LLIPADVALVKNNARVGSIIAVSLAAEMRNYLTNVEHVQTGTANCTTRQRSDEDAPKTSHAKTSANIVSFH